MRRSVLIALLICSFNVLAAKSVGEVAGNLNQSANILAKLMWAACIITGISLTVVSFTQFQTHRVNPKLVPLTTPIMYFILGLVAICIPFAERIIGAIDAYTASDQRRYIQQPDQRYLDDAYLTEDIDRPVK